jgi:hypothetical protein
MMEASQVGLGFTGRQLMKDGMQMAEGLAMAGYKHGMTLETFGKSESDLPLVD